MMTDDGKGLYIVQCMCIIPMTFQTTLGGQLHKMFLVISNICYVTYVDGM